MKELKFNEEMQRAIDEGRKTQTRRVVMLPGVMEGTYFSVTSPREELIELVDNELTDQGTINYLSTGGLSGPYECPYGKVGDINNGLKITNIRVERLHNITENDANAEGAMNQFEKHGIPKSGSISWYARNDFRHIWQSIYPDHPKKAWELNPWVWVITFEKV